jgi:transcriptional regulator with XRE-family HTH domain
MPALIASPSVDAVCQLWAAVIRTQRVAQGITADALCERIGISRSALRRLELGEPMVATQSYLSALWVLGLLDHFCPQTESHLTQNLRPAHARGRVRKPKASAASFTAADF